MLRTLVLLLLTAMAALSADDALAAMQRGDFAAAERILRPRVAAHPSDAMSLSLLGAALDSQKRLPEADRFHRRAVAVAPQSLDILNNFATHLMLAANETEARKIYLQVIALDPSQLNANVQLAQLALKGHDSKQAEHFLEAALKSSPASFDILYDLGITATSVGHYDRAREVLQAALLQQPTNVEVLFNLAFADEALKRWEAAVELLAQAAHLDPKRADVQKLLAITATELDALGDAATAWDRYLKLRPADDSARRERAFTAARMGEFEAGIAGLEAYAARHPNDAMGHYELGQAQRGIDVSKALAQLDQAIALEPSFEPARSARGSLFYQDGHADAALKDLELAATLRPDDAVNLDRLGQTYQTLDRAADAVRVLREAARLAPRDSRIQLHFGRALADSGNDEESKAVMERFRQLGPEKKNGVPTGLVDYLALTPEERRANYRARVEKTILDHPDDPAAQLDSLRLLLEDGKFDGAALTARRLVAIKPAGAELAEAGRALLGAKQYVLAEEVLSHASGADLELSIAAFYASGAARAGAIRVDEELERTIRSNPQWPDPYLTGAGFLAQNGRVPEAVALLDRAAGAIPQDREILLRRAVALELARRSDDAERQLKQIASLWPEWYPVWLAEGMILSSHGRAEEGRKALETASALGAPKASTEDGIEKLLFR